MQDDRTAATLRLKKAAPQKNSLVLAKCLGSLLVAVLVAFVPSYVGLESDARTALFILVLAAGLWITEGMPAFAVGLLVIGLAVVMLGRSIGVAEGSTGDWEKYLATWGSPLIWLFFGGFVLAQAAEKTGLSTWISRNILGRLGRRPAHLLAGCMLITFVFSMFISNTAATIMMVAVVMPIVKSMHHADRFRSGLLIGIAVAANLGGMATIIGSPPNAIAVGALRNVIEIDFLRWSLIAAPPAFMLLMIAWCYLAVRFGSWAMSIDLKPLQQAAEGTKLPRWKIGTVMLVFTVTILLWLTQGIHGIPVTVVSFLPICIFTALGILDSDDVCRLRWDVLLLIAGGLSLGLAVTDTGLANWMVGQLPLASLGVLGLSLTLAFVTAIVSNFMSNTAAANILVPIAMVASVGTEAQVVIPLAIGASAAMALPISTPPNAIVFSSKEVRTPQLMECGLLIGLLAPIISTFWCNWVVRYVL